MIRFVQIKSLDEIVSLDHYFVLRIHPDALNREEHDNLSIIMLQVEDHIVNREARSVVSAQSAQKEIDSSSGERWEKEQRLADSITDMLKDCAVLAEPESLQLLRAFLEQYDKAGEIHFVPVLKLAHTVFPDLQFQDTQECLTCLNIELPDAGDSLSDDIYAYDACFQECQFQLGRVDEESVSAGEDESPKRDKQSSGRKKHKKRISNKTLHKWADKIWSGTLWVIIGAAMLLVFLFARFAPHEKTKSVDRNVAPINYLVLSWNDTGKYGTRPRGRNGADNSIQFRIPYGVYNVLNNNSIPVEVSVITEGSEEDVQAAADAQADGSAEAAELSTKTEGKTDQSADVPDEDEENPNSSVTLRPNSSRQITIDQDQYLTLSENANELIFFYLSEVPEEKESDTTGQDSSSGRVVYAYVKGTEVRFRRAPSLEGQIIDTLNNGQQVQVLGVTGEWTHVSVQNQKGYIFSQFLTSEDPNAVSHVELESQENDTTETESTEEPGSDSTQAQNETPTAAEAGNQDLAAEQPEQ